MKGIAIDARFAARLCRAVVLVVLVLVGTWLPRMAFAAGGDSSPPPIKYINGQPILGTDATVNVYGVYDPYPTEEMNGYGSGGVLTFGGSGRNYLRGDGRDFSFNNNTATTDKNKDKARCQGHVGDPVEVDDGAKLLSIPLFQMPGEMGLNYTLYYRSVTGSSIDAFEPWTSSISYVLDLYCGFTNPNALCGRVTLYRPDGSSVSFSGNHVSYGNFPEIGGGGLATLIHNTDGTWTLHDEDAIVQTYNSGGQLTSIKDAAGIGWTITNSISTSAIGAASGTVGTPPIEPCSAPDGGVQPLCTGQPPPPPPQNKTTTTVIVTHTDGQSFKVVSVVVNQTTYITGSVTVTDPAGNQYVYSMSWYEVPGGSGLWAWDVASLTFPGGACHHDGVQLYGQRSIAFRRGV